MEIRIKGLRLKIDFSFILVISFALLYGYQSALHLLILSVLHELGHLAALVAFKARVYEISLSFFGFGIKYNGLLSLKQEAAMLFCGPLVNLFLFTVFRDKINLLLFLLNIIPVFPLDGGRLLLLLMPDKGKYISTLFLILLFIFSVGLLIRFKIVSLILIAVYLLIFNLRFV